MRFAWLRENSSQQAPLENNASRLIFIAYNLLWWVPVVLTIAGVIDYRAGFIAFSLITLIRSAANLYRNNALDPLQAEVFPLRSP